MLFVAAIVAKTVTPGSICPRWDVLTDGCAEDTRRVDLTSNALEIPIAGTKAGTGRIDECEMKDGHATARRSRRGSLRRSLFVLDDELLLLDAPDCHTSYFSVIV